MSQLLLPLMAFNALCLAYVLEDDCNGVCGRRPVAGSHSTSIQSAGGIKTLPGTWPWMVSIRTPLQTGYEHTCGGSLLGANWILTAAHCFRDNKTELSNWQLLLGTSELSRPGPDAEIRFPKRVVQHRNYEPHREVNDIALIELDDPIKCNDYIQPACLPDSSLDVNAMVHCYIAGWGLTAEKGKTTSDILKEAKVDLIPMEKCNSSSLYHGNITTQNLCAGFEQGGIDACQGDSGSPLMCRDDRSERYWIVGITSWGLGCGRAHKPGVYTSIQYFYKWIQSYTEAETTTAPPQSHTSKAQWEETSSSQPETTAKRETTHAPFTGTERAPEKKIMGPQSLSEEAQESRGFAAKEASVEPSVRQLPEPRTEHKPLKSLRIPQMVYDWKPPAETETTATTRATTTTTTTTYRPYRQTRRKKKAEKPMIISNAYGSRVVWSDDWSQRPSKRQRNLNPRP